MMFGVVTSSASWKIAVTDPTVSGAVLSPAPERTFISTIDDYSGESNDVWSGSSTGTREDYSSGTFRIYPYTGRPWK